MGFSSPVWLYSGSCCACVGCDICRGEKTGLMFRVLELIAGVGLSCKVGFGNTLTFSSSVFTAEYRTGAGAGC